MAITGTKQAERSPLGVARAACFEQLAGHKIDIIDKSGWQTLAIY